MATLSDIVSGARGLVEQARQAVETGTACSSFWLGDESGCSAQRHLVTQLSALVDKLDAQAARGITTQADLDGFSEMVRVVAQEASSTVDDASVASWSSFSADTLREIGAQLGAAVAEVGDIAVKGIGSVAGGLAEGLGPFGLLIVAGVVWFAFVRRTA